MPGTRRFVVAAFALPLLAAAASAQVIVDAGPNQKLRYPSHSLKMAGSISNGTPLDFWVADGDNATENYLLKYSDKTGVVPVGPLQTTSGQVFGWPSDLERVNGVIYGIETFHRKLYTLDDSTGICTPVGAQVSYTTLSGLAYDTAGDKLYGVDQKTRKLLKFDRSTGKATVILTLPAAHLDVRGLAWRKADAKLYYTDDATEAIYRVDPVTGVNEFVLALNDGPNVKLDELDFFRGRLYGSLREYDPNTNLWSMRLVLLDLDDGEAHFLGPVIRDCSAHALVVNSLPEKLQWVQVSGPATVKFQHPDRLDTSVYFPNVGTYVLELQAIGPSGTVRDQVAISFGGPYLPGPLPNGPVSH